MNFKWDVDVLLNKNPGRLSEDDEDVDVVSWFGLMTVGGFTWGF